LFHIFIRIKMLFCYQHKTAYLIAMGNGEGQKGALGVTEIKTDSVRLPEIFMHILPKSLKICPSSKKKAVFSLNFWCSITV